MIANAAFLSAMVLLLLAFVVLGDVSFLAPYKYLLLGPYLWPILGFATLVFLKQAWATLEKQGSLYDPHTRD